MLQCHESYIIDQLINTRNDNGLNEKMEAKPQKFK